ncbi:MAG: putative DNA binding domain-containing protein [Planctomycetaceae bacterium]|jgi:ATP-dependent DNA helicase RecG|nr:putative DNA binding domain-containing protein [Planctomycetaceae bacterium]
MIPLKLETLLGERVVEQDRVEYKRAWTPTDIIHTICAFANDFTNTNGGYIVIGIDEEYGHPVLPPVGVSVNALDKIQKELFQYCNLIEPRYIPQYEIIEYQGKQIIYLWCSAGSNGPYKAPKDVFSGKKTVKQKEYWIKPFSVKTVAKDEELTELFDKFNTVPFDDRINREASVLDIRRGYIEDFLTDSKSALLQDRNKPIEDLLLALEVANKTDVGIDIRNIGLLMFSDHPEKHIPDAQIELIQFNSPEAEGSDDFTEKIFKCPIQTQIRDALHYIQSTLITEKVVKHQKRAEAERFFNYPFGALEESLVNAVFHKSYMIPEPVEIRIYLDNIKIINYPGPAKSINMEKFKSGQAIARRYRNRRIGEFLKEIDLSEKKSTGITKILRQLKLNGSAPPEFETDDERSYLITTIKIHENFEPVEYENSSENERSLVENERSLSEDDISKLTPIIEYLRQFGSITPNEAQKVTGKSPATVRRYFKLLCEKDILVSEGNTNNLTYSFKSK